MKYIMCTNCGRKLCKIDSCSKVDIEIDCPKCGEAALITVKGDELLIRHRPMHGSLVKQQA